MFSAARSSAVVDGPAATHSFGGRIYFGSARARARSECATLGKPRTCSVQRAAEQRRLDWRERILLAEGFIWIRAGVRSIRMSDMVEWDWAFGIAP